MGRCLPHVEAKIVDVNDRGKILPIGEKGELVVSGYLVMKGYWGDQARTEEVRTVNQIRDEHGNDTGAEQVWMHTGDEAQMDAEGYVSITGRIKDLIIRGGENIHPLEVEDALFSNDLISEASVVGLPDERYGEVVAAFVVVHKGVTVGVDDAGKGDPTADAGQHEGKVLTKEGVRDWVRSRLSNHLVPKYVFWATEYPKTPSGKIMKYKLKEIGTQMLKDAEIKRAQVRGKSG